MSPSATNFDVRFESEGCCGFQAPCSPKAKLAGEQRASKFTSQTSLS